MGASNHANWTERWEVAEEGKPLTVNCVFQSPSSLELRLFGRRYLDCFTGARVPALRCGAVRNSKGTKPNEPNFITSLQRIGDNVNHAVNGTRGIFFGKTGIVRDCCNKIVLIQRTCPPKNLRWTKSEKDDVSRIVPRAKSRLRPTN